MKLSIVSIVVLVFTFCSTLAIDDIELQNRRAEFSRALKYAVDRQLSFTKKIGKNKISISPLRVFIDSKKDLSEEGKNSKPFKFKLKPSGENALSIIKKIKNIIKDGEKPKGKLKFKKNWSQGYKEGGYGSTPNVEKPYNPSSSHYNPYKPNPHEKPATHKSNPYGKPDYHGNHYQYSMQHSYPLKDPYKIHEYENKTLPFKVLEHSKHQEEYSSLNLGDFKKIWANMMYSLRKILKDEDNYKASPHVVELLTKLFQLLQYTTILPKKAPSKCPYTYVKSGSLCLSAEFLNDTLTWEEARYYCHMVKGGDLAIFRDACEFKEIIDYLLHIDPLYEHNYWIGGTSGKSGNVWKFIDGTLLDRNSSLWASDSMFDDLMRTNYTIISGIDYFLLRNVSNATGVRLHSLPLCQYIPERDGKLDFTSKSKGWGPYAAYAEYKKYEKHFNQHYTPPHEYPGYNNDHYLEYGHTHEEHHKYPNKEDEYYGHTHEEHHDYSGDNYHKDSNKYEDENYDHSHEVHHDYHGDKVVTSYEHKEKPDNHYQGDHYPNDSHHDGPQTYVSEEEYDHYHEAHHDDPGYEHSHYYDESENDYGHYHETHHDDPGYGHSHHKEDPEKYPSNEDKYHTEENYKYPITESQYGPSKENKPYRYSKPKHTKSQKHKGSHIRTHTNRYPSKESIHYKDPNRKHKPYGYPPPYPNNKIIRPYPSYDTEKSELRYPPSLEYPDPVKERYNPFYQYPPKPGVQYSPLSVHSTSLGLQNPSSYEYPHRTEVQYPPPSQYVSNTKYSQYSPAYSYPIKNDKEYSPSYEYSSMADEQYLPTYEHPPKMGEQYHLSSQTGAQYPLSYRYPFNTGVRYPPSPQQPSKPVAQLSSEYNYHTKIDTEYPPSYDNAAVHYPHFPQHSPKPDVQYSYPPSSDIAAVHYPHFPQHSPKPDVQYSSAYNYPAKLRTEYHSPYKYSHGTGVHPPQIGVQYPKEYQPQVSIYNPYEYQPQTNKKYEDTASTIPMINEYEIIEVGKRTIPANSQDDYTAASYPYPSPTYTHESPTNSHTYNDHLPVDAPSRYISGNDTEYYQTYETVYY